MTCCTSWTRRNCTSLRRSQLQRTSWTACSRSPEWKVRRPVRHCWTPSTATSQTCYKGRCRWKGGVRNAKIGMRSGCICSHYSSKSFLWLFSIFTGTNLHLFSCMCTSLLHPLRDTGSTLTVAEAFNRGYCSPPSSALFEVTLAEKCDLHFQVFYEPQKKHFLNWMMPSVLKGSFTINSNTVVLSHLQCCDYSISDHNNQ